MGCLSPHQGLDASSRILVWRSRVYGLLKVARHDTTCSPGILEMKVGAPS